jgi:hypothetical protein
MPAPDHERELLEALQGAGSKPKVLPSLDADTTERIENFSLDHPEHTTSVSAPPSAVTVKNLWQHPDTHPIVLDLAMLRQFGPDWLGWESETLRVLIPETFKTASVSDLNLAKLQACKTLHLVDAFWQRWEVFIVCAMPFNEEFPDFETMQVPTVAQCLVAADIAARIRQDVEWSSEMKAYFVAVYHHDGIYLPLPPLDFVEVDHPDGISQEELKKRWEEVRAKGKAPTAPTALDEQLRRLLVANGYLEESRARLQQQLHLHA